MKKLLVASLLAVATPMALAGTAAPIPEPSTWALFGAAATAIYLISKFKK